MLWNGLNLERWFERFFGNLRDVPRAVLTEGIEPIGIEEGPYVGKPNPHSWMSPRNALIYVENIRRALVELDPANAATYNANAIDDARSQLEKLAPANQQLTKERDEQSSQVSDLFSKLGTAEKQLAMPKKPSTTDGIAEMNSIHGLMNFRSASVAIWFT